MNPIFEFLAALGIIFSPSGLDARGGVDIGNGGDRLPAHYDTGWFIGSERTIEICIDSADNFPISKELIANSISQSFAKWIDYIEEKGVYQKSFIYESEEDTETASALKFASKIKIALLCRGTEDLTFYFGRTNTEIERNLRRYTDPISFVARQSYNLRTGWGKGFVWINATGFGGQPWLSTEQLDPILLHEIGHIFGVGHIPETIMSEQIVRDTASRLHADTGLVKHRWENLNTIDTERELFSCLNCDKTFLGSGPIRTCELRFQDRYNWDFFLECFDVRGNSVGTIARISDPISLNMGVEIFNRTVVDSNGNTVREAVHALSGQIIYGRMVNPHGLSTAVILERNLNSNLPELSIKSAERGEIQILFQSERSTGITAVKSNANCENDLTRQP